MKRILKFSIIGHPDHSAGFNGFYDEVEIHLDCLDENLTNSIEMFRETLRYLYDTSDVATEEEREKQYRQENGSDSI